MILSAARRHHDDLARRARSGSSVLAALLLGERVDAGRWLAVAAGFVGVAIALNPTGASLSMPALIAAARQLPLRRR